MVKGGPPTLPQGPPRFGGSVLFYLYYRKGEKSSAKKFRIFREVQFITSTKTGYIPPIRLCAIYISQSPSPRKQESPQKKKIRREDKKERRKKKTNPRKDCSRVSMSPSLYRNFIRQSVQIFARRVRVLGVVRGG